MKKSIMLFIFIAAITIGFNSLKAENIQLLVFSKTNGFRHESIPSGIKAFQKIALEQDWSIQYSEDSTQFTTENLKSFDVIVFLSTTGDIFNEEQKAALKDFVESGKSLLTIHSGTNTEESWPWYVNAVGGIFLGHPPTQKATVIIEDREHPSTQHFTDKTWEAVDEWYSFDRNPRENVHVLISIDETSYDVDDNRWFNGAKQRMGDHPLVWYKKVGEGFVFQTAFGHTHEMYSEPIFLTHLIETIKWLKNKNK